MRSIEEIEADIKATTDNLRAINIRLAELRTERADVTVANSGLLGHAVSYHRYSFRKRPDDEIRFLVEGVSRWGGAGLRGRVIKKDGRLGVREVEASASVLTDHGVYEAPK